MWRYIFLAVTLSITAVRAPVLFEKVMDAREQSQKQSVAQQTKPVKVARKPTKSKRTSVSGRKVRLQAGYGGHFYAQVSMNNRPVKVLVDTGATMVAINESTARKIGIHLKASDFKYNVNTANGTTKMAAAMIKEIKIGNIKVRNVRAGVSRDGALSTTLLGMSFLNQLKRFEVKDDTLTLEQ